MNKQVWIAGQPLAITECGSGLPVVLLAGFGGYKEIWTAQLADLKGQLHLISMDYRGQGASGGTIASNLATLADDVAQLLKQLQVVQPVIVGHSLGASVIAALRQRHPELAVRGVVIVDQSPKMCNTTDWPFGFNGLTPATCQQLLHTPVIRHETLRGLVPSVLTRLIHAESQHPFDRANAIPLLMDHFTADWRSVALRETVPTLLMTARQSPYFHNGYGQWLATRNTMIQEIRVADCGHDIMAEDPAAFNQTLWHFMKRLNHFN